MRSEDANYLAQLTILSETVVKNAIAGVKLVLLEEQRDPFSKIMDLYTPELERLAEQKNSKANAASKSESKSEYLSSLSITKQEKHS